MTILAAAIVWSSVDQSFSQGEQDADIDALEQWKRSVERQVDWLKLDHDEWVERLQKENPELNVPTNGS
jgi:hypothetical protein